MLIIGIDPGLTGAFAVLDHHGNAVAVHDLPVMPIPEAGPKATIKTEIDVRALYTLLRSIIPADETALCVMEHASSVGSLVGEQAKLSLAATKASVMAVLRLQGLDVRRVAPVTWKRAYGIKEPEKGLGLPDGKKQALAHARHFYGRDVIPLEKHHNRAEALLIARFGKSRFA
jgi:Holliday junction resolvasome RuvABC endonuclease subunit